MEPGLHWHCSLNKKLTLLPVRFDYHVVLVYPCSEGSHTQGRNLGLEIKVGVEPKEKGAGCAWKLLNIGNSIAFWDVSNVSLFFILIASTWVRKCMYHLKYYNISCFLNRCLSPLLTGLWVLFFHTATIFFFHTNTWVLLLTTDKIKFYFPP